MGNTVARSFNTAIGETSNVRDVADKMLLLEEDRTPLYVLTNQAKRMVKSSSPRLEWFEQADLSMLTAASNGTTAYASNATGVFVADITLFGVGDVVAVARAAGTNSQQEELILVTAVSGTTNGTITVTRAFAGSTADTIGATNALKILGVATTENGSIDNPRSPALSPKTSACQIFEWPIQITRTGAATKHYGASNQRAQLQLLGMRRQKMEIENAMLFGKYSETLASPGSRYSTMGVRSIISTNVTDGGGTLTYATFLSFSRNAFRYGSAEKLLMAAPIVKEALDYIAGGKQQIQPAEKQFGVSLKRFITSNGTWLLANNYNMDGGASDEALGIDLPSIEFAYLEDNGVSLNTKIYQDYDPTNPKLIKDLILTQAGARVWHEARHSRLYDVSTYSS